MAAKFGGSLKCTVCAKSVYPQEKVGIEKVTVHKACFKCNTCNTTLTVGNYHVVDDKLLCKNHYQQAFVHKAPAADVKSTTPRSTAPSTGSTVDTKKQEEDKKRADDEKKKQEAARVEAEKKKQDEDKKKAEQAKKQEEEKKQQAAAAKPAVTPVKPAVTATTTPAKPAVTATTTPAKPAVTATTTPAKPAATPVTAKPAADDSKALESLKQFSAALDKLEHALTAVERRL